MRVCVIGGGIVGVAVAHALADAAHLVTIVDRGPPEGAASSGNAGWIADMDVMPLASAKVWAHVPRWVVDPVGPFSIAPAYVPRLLPWLLRFMAASRPLRVAAGSHALRALNRGALAAWERRLRALGHQGLLRRPGILSVWTDAGAYVAAAGLHTRQRDLGIPVERLDGDRVRALEPAFGRAVVGGALYPGGTTVGDPRHLLDCLTVSAGARGVDRVEGTVLGLSLGGDGPISVQVADREPLLADRVVVAAGAWSKRLAAMAGDAVPLDTERGYNITLPPHSLGLSRPIMYEGMGFVTTPLDTGDRIGGSVEFAGLAAPPQWRRIAAMVAQLQRVLPAFRAGDGVRWMGFRPSLPDSLPVIGRARADHRVIHAFGHGHYGLTQAAVTADLVAALVAERDPMLDMTPYSAQRF